MTIGTKMIEIKTRRLMLLSVISIENNVLILDENSDDTISLLRIKPTTGREQGFVAYLRDNPSEEVCHISFIRKRSRLEMTYGTEEMYRKKGYMYEAVCTVLKWFFENTSHERLWGYIGNNNTDSRKLAQKAGFIKTEEYKDECCWYVLEKDHYLKML